MALPAASAVDTDNPDPVPSWNMHITNDFSNPFWIIPSLLDWDLNGENTTRESSCVWHSIIKLGLGGGQGGGLKVDRGSVPLRSLNRSSIVESSNDIWKSFFDLSPAHQLPGDYSYRS